MLFGVQQYQLAFIILALFNSRLSPFIACLQSSDRFLQRMFNTNNPARIECWKISFDWNVQRPLLTTETHRLLVEAAFVLRSSIACPPPHCRANALETRAPPNSSADCNARRFSNDRYHILYQKYSFLPHYSRQLNKPQKLSHLCKLNNIYYILYF